MTITFLAPDGVELSAQHWRQGSSAVYGGGSGRRLGARSGFRVDTPSNVLTATSTTWTLTPCVAMIDPGFATAQGAYPWATDANVSDTVTAADATNPRKDIVYIQVNDSSAGDGSGALTANVEYLAGTPGVDPDAPDLPARSFLVGTINVPIAGGGSPTVTLNPARFVAAGAPLPTISDDDRLSLSKYDGLEVLCLDLAGRPTRIWNGSTWLSKGTEIIHASTADGTWAYNVTLTRSLAEDGVRSVTMGLIVARIGGGAFTVGTGSWTALFADLIPAGWRPNDNVYTCGGFEFAPTGTVTGAVLIQVRTSGQVDAQGVTGSISMGNPTKVTASAHWTAA